MVILVLLPLLFGDFVQKWYIPRGMTGECGRILVSDTDRDGNYEFYIRTYGGSQRIYIYELHLPNTWESDSFPYLYSPLIWDTGDFDADGLADIVIEASATQSYPTMVVSIAESPDSFSYPIEEVWRDTVGPPLVMPISSFDIDRDGYLEIVKMGGDIDTAHYTDFLIYETVGNNVYSVNYTIATAASPTSTVAFGDFDQDTFNEFAIGTIDGEYSIFESPANNTYGELILNQQLPTLNIKDCFSVPDADGDGKMEFVVKGFVIPTARVHAFVFEATGDNTYEIKKYFDLHAGDYYGGYSDAGDVDGDSIPEIVLEARQNVFIIKAAGNDSFYVWDTLPGNWGGSSVRVYDVDDNGLSDVIISGGNTTRIFEYELGIAETQEAAVQRLGIDIHPNPFSLFTDIRFRIADNGQKCELKIYDITGRLVTNLSEQISVSSHQLSVRWDGTDNHGNPLPAGVYFVRIQSSKGVQSVPVVLLR